MTAAAALGKEEEDGKRRLMKRRVEGASLIKKLRKWKRSREERRGEGGERSSFRFFCFALLLLGFVFSPRVEMTEAEEAGVRVAAKVDVMPRAS